MKIEWIEQAFKAGQIDEDNYTIMIKLFKDYPENFWLETHCEQTCFDELLIDRIIVKYGVSFYYIQPEII